MHCFTKGKTVLSRATAGLQYLDTLKNMFVERSTQYTSFSSRKQPANAGTECKQFIENASVVALWHFNSPYWRMRIQNALLLPPWYIRRATSSTISQKNRGLWTVSTFFEVTFWWPKTVKWSPDKISVARKKRHFVQYYTNVWKNQNGCPTIAVEFKGAHNIWWLNTQRNRVKLGKLSRKQSIMIFHTKSHFNLKRP